MIEIFKPDGTLQCGLGKERTIDEMTKDLEKLGVTPASAEKRQYPGNVIALCGAPTGACNVFALSGADWPEKAKVILGAGFHIWPEAPKIAGGDSVPWPWLAVAGDEDPYPWARRPNPFELAALMQGGDPQPWPWFGGDTPFPLRQTKGRMIAASRSGSTTISELIGMKLRVYRNGDAVSDDYVENRVNIGLNRSSGSIDEIWFG